MTRACLAPVRAAVGDQFSDAEIDEMLARLAARYQRLRSGAANATADDPALWRQAFESLAVEEARASLIEARLRAASATARARRQVFYSGFTGRPDEALRTLLVGSERAGAQRGLSVDARMKALEVDLTSRFTEALEKEGQLSRLANPWGVFAPDQAFEAEVAREIARLNGEQRPASRDGAATRVAQIIVEDQKKVRTRMNALGAWIGEIEGYVTRQTHDPIKVGGGFWRGMGARAGAKAQQEWVDFITPRLHERTFANVDEVALKQLEADVRAGGAAPSRVSGLVAQAAPAVIARARRQWLEQIWLDIVSGYRKADGPEPDDLDGFRPPASVARQLSAERVLHFQDADAFVAYDQAYGGGSIFAGHVAFLARAAQTEALLSVFGPAPEASFAADRQRLTEAARAAGDVVAMRGLGSPMRQNEFDEIVGNANRPASVRAATVGRFLRQWTQLAKLGGMIFSSVTDLGAGGQALARVGVEHFKTLQAQMGALADLTPSARQEAANLVGEGARVMAGDIAAQFIAPDANLGALFKAQRLFYRINAFGFWQARMRAGAGAMIGRHLGTNASLAFDALPPALREGLGRYGLDAAGWEAVRSHAQPLDGAPFLAPEAAGRVDDATAVAWARQARLFRRGRGRFAGAADDARRELQLRLQAFFTDTIDNAMTEPRARERAMLTAHKQAGTALGEALRLFMQFKSFPVSVLTRHVGPAFETATRARLDNLAPVAPLAHFLFVMTMLGFVAMSAKDMARGLAPMPLTDPTGRTNLDKIFLRSFIQGGGAGLYGDFILGDFDRMGRSPFAALSGPSVGEAERVFKMWSQLRDGEAGEAGAGAARFAVDNTPFANLFYLRPALNYLFLYQMQEALSPGYLERMERRAYEDRGGQTFWLRPTAAGAPDAG
jgi:hypothetical protein